jgi:hypothetical protein
MVPFSFIIRDLDRSDLQPITFRQIQKMRFEAEVFYLYHCFLKKLYRYCRTVLTTVLSL